MGDWAVAPAASDWSTVPPAARAHGGRAAALDPTEGIDEEIDNATLEPDYRGPAGLLAKLNAKVTSAAPALAAAELNAVPFGLGPRLAGTAARALRPRQLSDLVTGDPLAQDKIAAASNQLSAEHPGAALAGRAVGLAGELATGGAAEEAIASGAAKLLPGVASKVARAAKASPILTTAAKTAAAGAGYGAADAAGEASSQDQDVGAAALHGAEAGGASGAVLGAGAGLADKVIDKGAPAIAKVVGRAAEGAKERQIERASDALELKVNKGTRAGLRTDAVENAIAENPELRKAAGNDEKVAQFTAGLKKKAGGALEPIYQAAGPADEAAAKAVANVDERIAELKKGDANDAAAAKKLQALRDEFNNRLGERPEVTASDLRAEQSAYQKNGYAKNINADPDVTASILAQREMSKAVGDAVVEHVTGMSYADAKAAAAADPGSLSGRLFKANEQINAANKIEAGVADRAGRVKPKEGLLKMAAEIKHSPTGFALSKIPAAAAAAGAAVDNQIVARAPSILERLRSAAAAGNPRAQRLVSSLAARSGAAVGTAVSGTLAGEQ
jgi:hypothetical protein